MSNNVKNRKTGGIHILDTSQLTTAKTLCGAELTDFIIRSANEMPCTCQVCIEAWHKEIALDDFLEASYWGHPAGHGEEDKG